VPSHAGVLGRTEAGSIGDTARAFWDVD
jgi:hypothetical protein